MRGWKRLRTRLVATYLLLALVLLGVAGLVFSKALTVYANEVQSNQQAVALSQVKQMLPQLAQQGVSPWEVQAQLQQMLPDWKVNLLTENAGYVAVGPKSTVPAPLPQPPSGDPADSKATFLKGLAQFMISKPTLGMGGAFTMPVVGTDGTQAAAVLRISLQPKGAVVLQTLLWQVVTILALALLLAGLIGWWFTRWLLRPISHLTGATAAVAGGDFLQTVESVGIDELDRLTTQFNTMVVRLRDSFRSLGAERDVARRFAADAAHELRTPVTAMRTYQEIWAEHPDRAAQMLPAISRQVDRLERVIGGLLQLASLTESAAIELAPVDLGAAVDALAPGLAGLAEEYGQSLTITRPDAPVVVRLDTHLLEQILYNLADNACKYTPPGGRIDITVTALPAGARLTVADQGPGIPSEEVSRVFERFHRGINTQSIPGSGLGLAIVQEAVHRLGGSIAVDSTPGEGSRFSMDLPTTHPNS